MMEHYQSADIAEKVRAGQRLSLDDGRRLYACPDPVAVGSLAHERRTALHGDAAYYVVNRHVNYTDVCVNGCAFCAYYKEEGQAGASVLTPDDVVLRLTSSPLPPVEVHMVGGCHPSLPLTYFEDLLRAVRAALPHAAIKAFTAVEIAHFATVNALSVDEVLGRLMDAGLDMLPGGGAEIFHPEVRERICPRKATADEWLDVHRRAHRLGLPTNCTMLFGHIESTDHRLDHLDRLRRLQDESLAAGAAGFTCCIPLPFLTANNALAVEHPLTGLDELRTIALTRLMLDNIPHVKAYWVMLGVKQAQAALYFGADDFDGTVVEERIGHSAGADSEQGLPRTEIEAMLGGCGCTPVERDAFFRHLQQSGEGRP